jgi:NAD(P)H-flavin reductase
MQAVDGRVPAVAQQGLKDTLRAEGYFLPCMCRPDTDVTVAAAADAAIFNRAVVTRVERCTPTMCRVFLEPATSLFYHPGQFINLRRHDGLSRSYSLASVPRVELNLELHVKRLPGGRMTSWIFDELRAGEEVDFQGPNGTCFYLPGRPGQPMLLIGNGSGLAPLIGIARDALYDGHHGPIHLYHGTRHPDGLYLQDALRGLAEAHRNFAYHACVSGKSVPASSRAGRADELAFEDHGDLTDWRVFLSGYPPMVYAAQKAVYLKGASLGDIHADPFELRELRKFPRNRIGSSTPD